MINRVFLTKILCRGARGSSKKIPDTLYYKIRVQAIPIKKLLPRKYTTQKDNTATEKL